MRYSPSDPRYDDPAGVMAHANRYKGGKALVVLGGYSAKYWRDIQEQVKPDVVIGANGVNAIVPNLDYWMCAENLTRALRMAGEGDPDAILLREMFYRESGAKTKLVSHRSWSRLRSTENCIAIRRCGFEENEIEQWFSFRDYGLGYLAGWEIKHKEAGATVHVGTVGAQLLHHAGILGCSEVHTIGYDLMFRGEDRHHAYEYPLYKEDRYRTDKFRIEYKGVSTQWVWLETAQWLKSIEPIFERDGLQWTDHSGGLLAVEGLKCTFL